MNNNITKKDLLYNFIFRASANIKIRTYYHLLEPLFHQMSDNNLYLNLGYDDFKTESPISIVETQRKMVAIVTNDFNKQGNGWTLALELERPHASWQILIQISILRE